MIGSGEHDVLSLIFRQLNWYVINFMTNKDLIARIGLYVSYLCFRLRACVEGFKHYKLIIQIKGTFIYGKYLEKLLIAPSLDIDGHIFPLTFGIVEEESMDS